MTCFNNIFCGSKVLVLGHTGFKGSWLTLWLDKLGAHVVGASIDTPTTPSHFESADVSELCQSEIVDIRKFEQVNQLFGDTKPDYLFHLAAQALVRRSVVDPVKTFETNTLGTINVLETLRRTTSKCIATLITSDKCYENIEMVHGYRETDRLGGKDPYSASKGAAELAIAAYIHSFLKDNRSSPVRIAVGRAGNVIGGGDWADDRLVPDAFKAWADGKVLDVRSPNATRPWQHVLEPLSGYLHLAAALSNRPELHGEPFNFGPRTENIASVEEVIKRLATNFDNAPYRIFPNKRKNEFYEAGLLKLSCDKALHELNWQPTLVLDEAIEMTANWYKAYHSGASNIRNVTLAQIAQYCGHASSRNMSWAN